MKIVLGILILLAFAVSGYSKYYDKLSPSERKSLSGDWLETGKAFIDNKKMIKARDSLYYVTEIYPMGDDAREAIVLLKQYFKLVIQYNPDKQFQFYIKKAGNSADEMEKLNNYLMALEIKDDKSIDNKVSGLYEKSGNTNEAKKYMELSGKN